MQLSDMLDDVLSVYLHLAGIETGSLDSRPGRGL